MRGTLYPGECYIRGFFVTQLLGTFYLGDRNFLEERYIPGNGVSVTDVISETNFISGMTLYPQGPLHICTLDRRLFNLEVRFASWLRYSYMALNSETYFHKSTTTSTQERIKVRNLILDIGLIPEINSLTLFLNHFRTGKSQGSRNKPILWRWFHPLLHPPQKYPRKRAWRHYPQEHWVPCLKISWEEFTSGMRPIWEIIFFSSYSLVKLSWGNLEIRLNILFLLSERLKKNSQSTTGLAELIVKEKCDI